MGTNIHTSENNEQFRTRMKDLAKEHDLNISQAAEYLGMSRRQYAKYISGEYDGKTNKQKYAKPSADMLCKIAEKYSVSVDYLLGRSDFRSAENEFIGMTLGLSDNAVSMMLDMQKNDRFKKGIDFLNATAEMKGHASISYILMLLYRYCFQTDGVEPQIMQVVDGEGNNRTLPVEPLYRESLKSDILYALDAVKFPAFR